MGCCWCYWTNPHFTRLFNKYNVLGSNLMTTIRYSTDSTSWTTATINLGVDGSNSTSWVSGQLSGAQVNSIVTANGIIGVINSNSLIISSTAPWGTTPAPPKAWPAYTGTFNTIYKKVAIDWTTQTSNFATSIIQSVAYGNGIWVAGGAGGQIRTSTDTTTWTTVTSNFGTSIIYSIAYGNGTWVAGAAGGAMRSSTNGTTWTTATSNFGASTIWSIAYGNGLWVAGAAGGAMRSSTDATTWTTLTSNFASTSIDAIAYANGLWFAGSYSGQMSTSTDTVTWTTVNSNFGATSIRSIAYANGVWLAGGHTGQIRRSINPSIPATINNIIASTTRTVILANSGRVLVIIQHQQHGLK
jgi:hypothetical protein